MKTYAEEEIKAYFDYIIKTCPNSLAAGHADMMKFKMFNTDFGKSQTLEEVTKKLKNQK